MDSKNGHQQTVINKAENFCQELQDWLHCNGCLLTKFEVHTNVLLIWRACLLQHYHHA